MTDRINEACVNPKGYHITCKNHRGRGFCAYLQDTASGYNDSDVLKRMGIRNIMVVRGAEACLSLRSRVSTTRVKVP